MEGVRGPSCREMPTAADGHDPPARNETTGRLPRPFDATSRFGGDQLVPDCCLLLCTLGGIQLPTLHKQGVRHVGVGVWWSVKSLGCEPMELVVRKKNSQMGRSWLFKLPRL